MEENPNQKRLKAVDESGRDYYASFFSGNLDYSVKWLKVGAIEKANSVEILLNNNSISPKSFLELGCGTGAVIQECQKRNLAESFTAIDYSNEALSYLREHSNDIDCIQADIASSNFSLQRDFDLVILSHVLEHLEQPSAFLQAIIKKVNFTHLLIEVPLEDLIASRLKNKFRNRLQNSAGHVQFYTPQSFRSLLASVGLKIIDERSYVPVRPPEVVRMVCAQERFSKFDSAIKMLTQYHLPNRLRKFWERYYYAHLAVLCQPLNSI